MGGFFWVRGILFVFLISFVTFAQTDEKPNVLIDDYIKNIKEWEDKGGIGIHHTAVPKTLNELKRLGFK